MKKFKPFSSYTDTETTKLFEKYGAFWAFSNEQFYKAYKLGVKYVQFWGNCFAPSDKAREFLAAYEQMLEEAKKRFLAENSRADIIAYSLANYESYYTGDLTEAIEELADYQITDLAEIEAIYRKNLPLYD